MTSYAYALVTPARNEEAFIGKTIESVLSQTIPPNKWVIVSDGSTDRTDEIVAGFAKQCGFIPLVRVENRGKRTFSPKANPLRLTPDAPSPVPYTLLANLTP